jgi:hypothetical protein
MNLVQEVEEASKVAFQFALLVWRKIAAIP